MATIRNFHEKLERDLERLTAEVVRRKETSKETPSREIVKQSLGALTPVASHVSPVNVPSQESVSVSHLPRYLDRETPEVRKEVEELVALAFQKGIAHATREAARRSPFLLDALHDALVEKLLPELEKRGIIK